MNKHYLEEVFLKGMSPLMVQVFQGLRMRRVLLRKLATMGIGTVSLGEVMLNQQFLDPRRTTYLDETKPQTRVLLKPMWTLPDGSQLGVLAYLVRPSSRPGGVEVVALCPARQAR